MRRLEQNGEILRVLLISGTVISMTMIVGTHSVTGSTSQVWTEQGEQVGAADCKAGKPYNDKQNPYAGDPVRAPSWGSGYWIGYEDAGCTPPPR